MARYGADISGLAGRISGQINLGTDPSADLLIHLALAWHALHRMQEQGVDLEFNGQPLALSPIERAYREAIFIRSRRIPSDRLDTSVISKLGRVANG